MSQETENNKKKPRGKNGGARPGSGRKKGTANIKTREIADRAAAEGITPLEVMIRAMREAYEAGGAIAAFPFAKDCAPFMHPRLATTQVTGVGGKDIGDTLRELNLRVEFVAPKALKRE